MQNFEFYKKLKGVSKTQDVIEYFLSTLLLTNRRWSLAGTRNLRHLL